MVFSINSNLNTINNVSFIFSQFNIIFNKLSELTPYARYLLPSRTVLFLFVYFTLIGITSGLLSPFTMAFSVIWKINNLYMNNRQNIIHILFLLLFLPVVFWLFIFINNEISYVIDCFSLNSSFGDEDPFSKIIKAIKKIFSNKECVAVAAGGVLVPANPIVLLDPNMLESFILPSGLSNNIIDPYSVTEESLGNQKLDVLKYSYDINLNQICVGTVTEKTNYKHIDDFFSKH